MTRRPPRRRRPPDHDRQRRARPSPRRASRDRRGPRPGPAVTTSTSSPSSRSASAAQAATASSDPVMLGIRTSARRSASSRSASIGPLPRLRSAGPTLSATEDRPGHAGRPAGAVDPDLGRRIGVDLAAGGREGRRRPRDCPRPGSRRRAAPRARCSRASGTPRRAPRSGGCRARRAAPTARPAAAAGRRPRGRRRPAR